MLPLGGVVSEEAMFRGKILFSLLGSWNLIQKYLIPSHWYSYISGSEFQSHVAYLPEHFNCFNLFLSLGLTGLEMDGIIKKE
ncbi:hypothetical protein K1719_027326 [Acacia pycnantha]|nr:hypothetical protein K1719_027326 [Acacia pycnantha]